MHEEEKKRADIAIVLIFFMSLALAGLVGAGFVINDYAQARASSSWPVREGIVLNSDYGRGLRYVYSVEGKSYESERAQFFTAFWQPEEHTYEPGDVVEVYYNPSVPETSVLRAGGAGLFFATLSVIFGSFVFLGIGGVVRTLLANAPMAVNEHATIMESS